jgi:hypothetical protein
MFVIGDINDASARSMDYLNSIQYWMGIPNFSNLESHRKFTRSSLDYHTWMNGEGEQFCMVV